MPRSMLTSLLAAVALLACFGGPMAMAETQGPEASLQRAVEAFAQGDAPAFARYVDAKRVVDRAVRDYLRASLAKGGALELPSAPDGDELLLNQHAVAIMTPTITGQVLDGLDRLLAEAPQRGLAGIGLPRGAFNPSECLRGPTGDPGIKFFRGVQSVDQHDGQALVRLKLHHAGLGLDLPVALRLEDRGGYWQVVEVVNVAENLDRVLAVVGPGWRE